MGSGLYVSHRGFTAQWSLPRFFGDAQDRTDGSLRMMAEYQPLPQRVTCDRAGREAICYLSGLTASKKQELAHFA